MHEDKTETADPSDPVLAQSAPPPRPEALILAELRDVERKLASAEALRDEITGAIDVLYDRRTKSWEESETLSKQANDLWVELKKGMRR